ncbi:uncharacterized protein K444DRAFT_609267 [Hyaloscypha bicolor E]|uniref:SnoaL-like domain-containing protein n=1 Tax=Hyaloscypha bicolor E TaxID=1095630 RepID=A0A2J6TM76_9HELO|nr:uncharacterized protein K444DRAFT_609267 [Hyaloscypha bicolor E]PMD64133.1 hypothetical protein K444DRAFT_609267 [Hyaloscypha bicolor E]
MMASASSTSALGKAALNVVAAYESWSIDNIMNIRTPGCVTEVQPASLAQPAMDNETYRAFFGGSVIPRLANWKLNISDIVEDPKAKKVVLFATAKADAVVTGGAYEQQYVYTFWFEEDGKIKRMIEWLDSAKLVEQKSAFFD